MKRIVCFGEMLLRLSPAGQEPLLRPGALQTFFGGAEANVAVSLAHFGLDAAMVTVLPDNPLGEACLSELRRHGVSVQGVRRSDGRMGLYFLSPGALLRPAKVIYDRAESAFARAAASSYAWRELLTGAGWLHVTGITPALSQAAADAVLAAVSTANDLGVPVSIDCNYRPALWRGREAEATRALRMLAERSQLLLGGARDAAMVFAADCGSGSPETQFERAAAAMFAACPKLRHVAATHRLVHNADHNVLTAFLADRDGLSAAGPLTLHPIVGRVGGGDAFAAGILFGLCNSLGRQQTVEFALAAAGLKHSTPGDFNLATAQDVFDALAPTDRDVRR